MTSIVGIKLLLMVLVRADVTLSIEDTLMVQDDTIATNVRLPTKRFRREEPSDFNTNEDIEVYEDDHTYYSWKVFKPARFDDYWIDLQDDSKHHYLSNTFDKAHRSNVTFDFLFYGHEIHVAALTTAGFISTSATFHTKMVQTQYISPYMANFDPSVNENSTILFEIIGNKFVVEWRDVNILANNRHAFAGPFTFQTVVHKNGTIVFAYKEMPFVFLEAKIGLADGMFFFDTHQSHKFTFRNYGTVNIDPRSIQEGTVVVLNPKPTCNLAKDCQTCVTRDIDFSCQWCSAVQRCSDGTDRGAQTWFRSACYHHATSHCDVAPANDQKAQQSTVSVVSSTETSPNRKSVTTPSAHGYITSTKSHKKKTTTSHKVKATTENDGYGTSTESHNVQTTSRHLDKVTTETDSQSLSSTDDQSQSTVHSTTGSEVELTADGPSTPAGNLYPFITESDTDEMNVKASKFSSEDSSDEPASSNTGLIVVLVLIIVSVIASVCGLFFYAYTHPSSRPAIWLLEHRPVNMVARWRKGKDQPAPAPSEATPVTKA